VLGFESLRGENFGFDLTSARSAEGKHSRLELKVAEALERSCEVQSSYACFLRFAMDELPEKPVLPPDEDDEGEGG
jgi:hypothetical protein